MLFEIDQINHYKCHYRILPCISGCSNYYWTLQDTKQQVHKIANLACTPPTETESSFLGNYDNQTKGLKASDVSFTQNLTTDAEALLKNSNMWHADNENSYLETIVEGP